MTAGIWVIGAAAVALTLTAWRRHRGLAGEGWLAGLASLRQQLPLLLLAFAMAGYVEVLVPRAFIERWLGAGAGLRGVLLGSVAGGTLPFGPYVILPMAAALREAGASSATLVAFTSGWMMWTTGKLAFEFATLGPGFSARRLALYAVFPPLAGLLTLLLFGS
ncbi:MAG: permease [bacterium]|nr:permease [bacterium]